MLEIRVSTDYNNCAVMKYYYLSADKQIQGPLSGSEIFSMRRDGIINDDTLLAVAGDNSWRPASSYIFETEESDCSTWNNTGEATVDEGTNSSKGILSRIACSIGYIFTWKGRINRGRFWLAFGILVAICSLIIFSPTWVFSPELAQSIIDKASAGQSDMDYLKELDWYIILYAYFLIVSWPVLLFSCLSFLVRRFHDVGFSAIWPVMAVFILFISIFLEDVVNPVTLLYGVDSVVAFLVMLICLWPGTKVDDQYGSISKS